MWNNVKGDSIGGKIQQYQIKEENNKKEKIWTWMWKDWKLWQYYCTLKRNYIKFNNGKKRK